MFESNQKSENQDPNMSAGPHSPVNQLKDIQINLKEEIKKRLQKNQSNLLLQNFKKVMAKSEIGNQIISTQEKVKHIPQNLEQDLDEAVLYAYFSVHYLNPHIFKIICTRTNKFQDLFEYHTLLGKERSYENLSNESSYSRFRLNQIAFQIAIDKDYYDVAEHFITGGTVHITWEMVRKMIQRDQQYLVKRCIKYQTKFDPGAANLKKIQFAGRTGNPLEDRTIKLVDFLQIMLDLKWSSATIVEVLRKYSKKNKIDFMEINEMFLLFAIKRKIKLLSFMINSEEFALEFQELHFISVLENEVFDIGVLLYREFFLQIKDEIETINNLLINSFTKSNGMLEAKCYLFKRFMAKMSYEQALKFLEAVESRVFDSSKGNLLIITMNVVKASCLLIELLHKVKAHFGFLSRRIEEIRHKITLNCREFMDDIRSEEEMRFYLLEKDFDDRDSLNIIYDCEILDLLEHPFARNIVTQIWTSKYNNSHSMFTVSTAHTLLFNFNHCRHDMEVALRFYRSRDIQKLGCHPFQFQVWRFSGSSRHIVETIATILFAILMHVLITQHMSVADFLLANREQISNSYYLMQGIDPTFSGTDISEDQMQVNDAIYSMWNQRIYDFDREAIILTYLMEIAWLFFFQHIWNGIFASKNKRTLHLVNFDNFLDFLMAVTGFSYAIIVYKKYRYSTFLADVNPYEEAAIYWQNYTDSDWLNESVVLLVYMLTLWIKTFMKLRLISFSGPLFVVLKRLLYDFLIFGLFYLAELILFALVGIVLFSDLETFSSLSSAMFELFQATILVYDVDMMAGASVGNVIGYWYFLTFLILNLVLIINLIVGLQSYGYKYYSKRRDVLMLIETMSVRESTEADDKYSSVVSAAFPLTIFNWLFGPILMGLKSETANIALLHLYFSPVAVTVTFIYLIYSFAIIPLCYLKMVGHKCALIVSSPEGQGARSTLDKTFQALFFLIFGLLILALDSLVDVFWFVKHMYTMSLDESHLQVQETTQVSRRTFQLMYKYFSNKNEQLVPQKKVAEDLRERLDILEGIKSMIYGVPEQIPDDKLAFYNAFVKAALSEAKHEKEEETPNPYEVERSVQEFKVVKQILLNNSMKVNMQELQVGAANPNKRERQGMKLLFDKKLFFRLLQDLERQRKILNLKKCFFIFHIPYEGKPREMNKWHIKVEERVSQTLKFLNTTRLLKIIGYDPVQRIKMENINLKRGHSILQLDLTRNNSLDRSIELERKRNTLAKGMNSFAYPGQNKKKASIIEPKDEMRAENLEQNLKNMLSKYLTASSQIKQLASSLRLINSKHGIDPPPMKKIQEKGEMMGRAIMKEMDINKQPRVNYISPSKVGVIQKPILSKEVSKQNSQPRDDLEFHDSSRNQSEAVVTEEDEDTGIHKESHDNNSFKLKKK